MLNITRWPIVPFEQLFKYMYNQGEQTCYLWYVGRITANPQSWTVIVQKIQMMPITGQRNIIDKLNLKSNGMSTTNSIKLPSDGLKDRKARITIIQNVAIVGQCAIGQKWSDTDHQRSTSFGRRHMILSTHRTYGALDYGKKEHGHLSVKWCIYFLYFPNWGSS